MNKLIYDPLVASPMVASGSQLLSAIQNDDMIPLDLLVRESIQNSLDAATDRDKPCRRARPVCVEFNLSECRINDIKNCFPELAIKTKGCGQVLEIRDTGTTGLTGPAYWNTGSDEGNFSKLVYDIGHRQRRHDAGGSWGLGKSVYYRMGIGLVLYYSRVEGRNNTSPNEERLAVCFVENETQKPEKRLIKDLPTGIAWWGAYASDAKEKHAVTDPKLIRRVLDVFNVKPFSSNEIGTSIIIPLLRNDLLPTGSVCDDDENQTASNEWYHGIEGYIAAAVQRWYCVRLNNRSYRHGPMLKARVNKKEITNSYPIFAEVQKMYNIATLGGVDEKCHRETVKIRTTFRDNSSCGWVVARKYSRSDLNMGPPDNERSPYEHIFNKEVQEPYPAITAYLRKPGMIVSWSDREWSDEMQRDPDGNFTIVLFVPDSTKQLDEAASEMTKTGSLEEYLRSTEKADHTAWRDRYNSDIIHRIRKNVVRIVNTWYKPTAPIDQILPPNLGLQRRLAVAFMPNDWGRDPSRPAPSPKGTGSSSIRGLRPSLAINELAYPATGLMTVNFSLYWGKAGNIEHLFDIGVASENGTIYRGSWLKDRALGKFPFIISELQIESVDNGKKGRNPECRLNLSEPENSIIKISKTSEAIHLSQTGESLSGWTVNGSLTIKFFDKTVQPVLVLTDGNDQLQGDEENE